MILLLESFERICIIQNTDTSGNLNIGIQEDITGDMCFVAEKLD